MCYRPSPFADSGSLPWLLVIGALSIDLGTTVLGLSLGLVELNPVAAHGIAAVGVAALPAIKAPALAIGLIGWRTLPDRYRQLTLLGLAVPWAGAGAMNGWLILAFL